MTPRREEIIAVVAPLRATMPRPLHLRLLRAWRTTLERLRPLGGISDGNRIDVYTSGDDAFGAMLAAVDGAKTRAWMETYIFEPDELGMRVVAALAAAARRGVDARLLYDVVGSPRCRDAHFAELEAAGGRAVGFNPPFFASLGKKLPIIVRDHRKILVVDDDTAFSGGMNVSVDYAGPLLGNSRFRDTHARVRGPAVKDLADLFRSSYQEACGVKLPEPPRPPPYGDGVLAQVLGSGQRRRRRHIQRALLQTLRRSVARAWLTTAYFVPPAALKRALMNAARRGVDVRVLTAGRSDVPLVAAASQHVYGRLLRAGVRVYEMQERTLHAKTATIDGLYATVGSFNLDRWSDRRLLEVNVTVLDEAFAARLEQVFQDDLRIAREVTLQAWSSRSPWRRFVELLAYWIARL